jgi:hypothetical protein
VSAVWIVICTMLGDEYVAAVFDSEAVANAYAAIQPARAYPRIEEREVASELPEVTSGKMT